LPAAGLVYGQRLFYLHIAHHVFGIARLSPQVQCHDRLVFCLTPKLTLACGACDTVNLPAVARAESAYPAPERNAGEMEVPAARRTSGLAVCLDKAFESQHFIDRFDRFQ